MKDDDHDDNKNGRRGPRRQRRGPDSNRGIPKKGRRIKKTLERVRGGYRPKAPIKARGAKAPSGTPYVWVRACGKETWVAYDLFRSSGKEANDLLASRGIILLHEQWLDLKVKVDRLEEFPPKPLIEQPGWSKEHYALPDGTVFGGTSDPDAQPPVVLFARNRRKVATRGTLEQWSENVAEPLAGQHIPTFVLMLMFAPPLLRLMGRTSNFGFELAGPKGVGKTTAQYLGSSVWGPAVSPGGANFWVSAHATVAGLESLMAEYDDMAFVIEEANLFAAGDTAHVRSAKTHQRIFQFAEGAEKARHRSTRQSRSRFLWLTSTNEPRALVMTSAADDVSAAAADRELTIPIGPDRQFGLFDFVPDEYGSASDFADALVDAVARYHGQPIRRFLAKLVAAKNADPKRLKARIRKLIGKFRKAVGVDTDSGSSRRVADAFGLVYAAGCLAKAYGALPSSLRCLKAVRTAYALNRSTVDHRSPLERLVDYAKRRDLIHFRDGDLPDLSAEAVNSASGFISTKKSGRQYLILTPAAIDRAFADRSLILNDAEVRKLLKKDGGRRATKQRLSSLGKPVRVYCFRLLADL